jgi:hypothetical protein
LGDGAGGSVTTASNVIVIGDRFPGANIDNICFISNIYGTTTANNDAVPVLIDSAGQLGTASSSRRYKTDIKQMENVSESILALKPVSFRYKVHKDKTPQFGLIAEEVAKVNPDLVIYDSEGKPYTVRYDAVNAMLLNEFLKEHKRVEAEERKINDEEAAIGDFKSMIAQQQKEIGILTAQLKEQATQIQRVRSEVEASKAATHFAVNRP